VLERGERCDFCGWKAPSARALEEHIAQAHAGRPFPPKCEICGEVFESPADLKAHHEGVHGARRS
jgi:C2H2 type zinc finger protein